MTSGLSRNPVNKKEAGEGEGEGRGRGEKNVDAETIGWRAVKKKKRKRKKREARQPFSLSYPSHGTTETTLEIRL